MSEDKVINRFKFYGHRCSCEIGRADEGEYILYSDHLVEISRLIELAYPKIDCDHLPTGIHLHNLPIKSTDLIDALKKWIDILTEELRVSREALENKKQECGMARLGFREQLQKIPQRNFYQANRYDTDTKHTLHLWDDDGDSYDIIVSKDVHTKEVDALAEMIMHLNKE